MTYYRCDQAIILLFHFRILNTYNALHRKNNMDLISVHFFVHIVTLSYLIKRETFPISNLICILTILVVYQKMLNLSPFCDQSPLPLNVHNSIF